MSRRWHILGAGSIGCLFAAKLQAIGCEVTLLFRANSDSQKARHSPFSFQLKGQHEQYKLTMPASYADDNETIEHLLVTTKAYDASEALASVAHRLDANSQVLLMVNGMGLIEELEERFPPLRFYAGTTTEGAYRQSKQAIVHAGTGITRIGRSDTLEPVDWFTDFSKLEICCTWDDDIHGALWQKLAVNCAINPLTALNGCVNGDLRDRESLAEKLHILCDEIVTVADAAGRHQLAANVHTLVNGVISNTAANRSSMLQDVEAKRRTEIDYISGYLIRRAKQLNVPAPENEKLLYAILKLESERSSDRGRE
ncbi:MAG: ketopantoate reductase family protein [Halioglobus sp.]